VERPPFIARYKFDLPQSFRKRTRAFSRCSSRVGARKDNGNTSESPIKSKGESA
jgi:hypothetical protein